MRKHLFLLLLLAFSTGTCVDRIKINVASPLDFPIVIDGFISDQPGPYKILVTREYDVQSLLFPRAPLSVKRLEISDDKGTSEVLSETSHGTYQTNANGIQGTVGRIYKLRIELLDGRVYESRPDTLLPAGKVDSVYYTFREEKTDTLTTYGFDVFFNSSGGAKNNYQFLWKFTGTFQADTNPELYDTLCVDARCPKPLPCSGYEIDKFTDNTGIKKVGPCVCCTCWYDFFNTAPLVSDNLLLKNGRFIGVKATNVPVTSWTFLYKVHAAVSQMSLSYQAFTFWKAVKAQREAINSLFQPITGKVASNFVQISGPDAAIDGIFYATSINSKAVYISRNDIHPQSIIPPRELPWKDSCLKLFPNSTTLKPGYWKD